MAGRTDWIVDGFQFGTEGDANLARNEKEKIKKLEERLDYNNPQIVEAVYKKAIENRSFKTPIGYVFLDKLHKTLEDAQVKDIPNIQVYGVHSLRERSEYISEKVKPSEKKQLTLLDIERKNKKKSIYLNIALVALVIAMFYISFTGSNPTVLNYERALQDKYSSWEQELSQREGVIREKERELLSEE